MTATSTPLSAPSESQLAKLMSLPADAPVAALNLFQFNAQAQYQPGDQEYGTDEANVTGEEAYKRYGAIAGQFVTECGGRVIFSTPVAQTMIGREDEHWDLAAIMYFPTRKAFMEMLTNPDFQGASRHRKAAMANHCMIHLNGEPFVV